MKRYQVLETGRVVLETDDRAAALRAAQATNGEIDGEVGDGCAAVYDSLRDEWVRE